MTVGVAAVGVVAAAAGAGIVSVVEVAFAISVGEGGVLTIRVSAWPWLPHGPVRWLAGRFPVPGGGREVLFLEFPLFAPGGFFGAILLGVQESEVAGDLEQSDDEVVGL